jgi:hypothetical protein
MAMMHADLSIKSNAKKGIIIWVWLLKNMNLPFDL